MTLMQPRGIGGHGAVEVHRHVGDALGRLQLVDRPQQRLRAAEREGVMRVASAGGFLMPERASGGFVPLRVVQPSPYGR